MDMTAIPEPKRGGTFLYCPLNDSCGMVHSRYSGSRFRTLKNYYKHWIRFHG
jgi:hypothetical protein